MLATGEQLCFASEDELLAAHCVPHYAVSEPQPRGARSFVDVRPFGGTAMDTLEGDDGTPAEGQGSAGGISGLPTIDEEDQEPTPTMTYQFLWQMTSKHHYNFPSLLQCFTIRKALVATAP